MRTLRLIALAGIAATCAACMTGCSVDSMIWGADGARVIDTTESLIADLAAGETSNLVCEDSQAELGSAADWEGRSAGEPERFAADYWDEQVSLDPQWNINVEGLPEGVTPGEDFPSDIFYRDSDDGLCVIDVVWASLVEEG